MVWNGPSRGPWRRRSHFNRVAYVVIRSKNEHGALVVGPRLYYLKDQRVIFVRSAVRDHSGAVRQELLPQRTAQGGIRSSGSNDPANGACPAQTGRLQALIRSIGPRP